MEGGSAAGEIVGGGGGGHGTLMLFKIPTGGTGGEIGIGEGLGAEGFIDGAPGGEDGRGGGILSREPIVPVGAVGGGEYGRELIEGAIVPSLKVTVFVEDFDEGDGGV